jgi:putative solute:sodium symporter small subunit
MVRRIRALAPGVHYRSGRRGGLSHFTSLQKPKGVGSMATQSLTPERQQHYWQRTSSLMWIIMVLWFIFSFALPLLAVQLNNVVILGFPLGFYMAAQGSLLAFVVLCFWSARAQNKIDEEFGVTEE